MLLYSPGKQEYATADRPPADPAFDVRLFVLLQQQHLPEPARHPTVLGRKVREDTVQESPCYQGQRQRDHRRGSRTAQLHARQRAGSAGQPAVGCERSFEFRNLQYAGCDASPELAALRCLWACGTTTPNPRLLLPRIGRRSGGQSPLVGALWLSIEARNQ